jgi:broad specificity phosphatase PhoE
MKIKEAGVTLLAGRHGESKAIKRKIIVSNLLKGIFAYGLTHEAKEQVKHEAETSPSLDKDTVIYSSVFKRTRQTAKIIQKTVGTGRIHYSWKLRERYFGDFDGQSSDYYPQVWKTDKDNIDKKVNGVESIASLSRRTEKLFDKIARRHAGAKVLLIGHGDGLKEAERIYKKIDITDREAVKHLRAGEIRALSEAKVT